MEVNQFNSNSISGQIELKDPKNQTQESESRETPDSPNQGLVQALADQIQICEMKILELVPNHPLPITQEHLGQPNPIEAETESLFKQIARYQEQVGYMAKGHQ